MSSVCNQDNFSFLFRAMHFMIEYRCGGTHDWNLVLLKYHTWILIVTFL